MRKKNLTIKILLFTVITDLIIGYITFHITAKILGDTFPLNTLNKIYISAQNLMPLSILKFILYILIAEFLRYIYYYYTFNPQGNSKITSISPIESSDKDGLKDTRDKIEDFLGYPDNYDGLLIEGKWGSGKSTVFQIAYNLFIGEQNEKKPNQPETIAKDIRNERPEYDKDKVKLINRYIFETFTSYSSETTKFNQKLIKKLTDVADGMQWSQDVFYNFRDDDFIDAITKSSELKYLRSFIEKLTNDSLQHDQIEELNKRYDALTVDVDKGYIFIIIDDIDRIIQIADLIDFFTLLATLKRIKFVKVVLIGNREHLDKLLSNQLKDKKLSEDYLNRVLARRMLSISVPNKWELIQSVIDTQINDIWN